MWTPQLTFRNAIGLPTVLREFFWLQKIKDERTGEDVEYVRHFMKIEGDFLENYELRRFPFDRQLFRVNVSSERSLKEITFRKLDRPNKLFKEYPLPGWILGIGEEMFNEEFLQCVQGNHRSQHRKKKI